MNQNIETIIIEDTNRLQHHIGIKDIVYLSYESGVSIFFIANGDNQILSPKPIMFWKKEFLKHGFCPINADCIINPDYIKDTKKKHRRYILLNNGKEFKVSRRQWYKIR